MLRLPENAVNLLREFNTRGYAAYVVGGCVRDMLMGLPPADMDIACSALPEETLRMFPHAIPTGLRHGTVTVVYEGTPFEVTTFRSDGPYADGRRPESVSFVDGVGGDLARRDFTINAMAADRFGEVTDVYGGMRDLELRLIRCVGVPEERFSEDALRMLRALRFRARIGFEIEESTLDAIKKCARLSARLAPERVRAEIEQILTSERPWTVREAIGLGLLDGYVSRRGLAGAENLGKLPAEPVLRWAGLCALLARENAVESAESFLAALRLPKKAIRSCGAGLWIGGLPETPAEIKALLRDFGGSAVRCACAAHAALGGEDRFAALEEVLSGGECWRLGMLAVTGAELLSLGLEGKRVGEMLEHLLAHVIENPGDNLAPRLLELARGWLDEEAGNEQIPK